MLLAQNNVADSSVTMSKISRYLNGITAGFVASTNCNEEINSNKRPSKVNVRRRNRFFLLLFLHIFFYTSVLRGKLAENVKYINSVIENYTILYIAVFLSRS